MWLIFCTCILSARHRLQVLAVEMKDSPEDKRDVRESEGKWHPAYQMPGNVIPPLPLGLVLGSGRTYEGPVPLDSRLGVRSSPQHSK